MSEQDLSPSRRRESWQDMALGAFLVGCAGLLVALFVMFGGWRLGHGRHVTAIFADATGLVADAPVVVAGVPVGRVEKLGVQNGQAVVFLDLQRDADVRADVTAVIRSRSLLGEKVVDLVGGGASAPVLGDGAVIRRTRSNIEADQLLTRLAPVLEKVDPDDVARLVRAGASLLSDQNATRLGRFADRLDRLVEAGGPKVLAILDKAEALVPKTERLLGDLAVAVPAMERLATHADELTGRTRKLVTSLDTRFATGTLRRADVVLERLPASLDRLDQLADRVSAALERAEPTLDRLGAFVTDANIRRILREEGVKIHVGP